MSEPHLPKSRKENPGQLPIELPTRHGHDAHEIVSWLQKAIRRSDVDAALYCAVELGLSYPDWLVKRLRIISSEDVDPTAGVVADTEALIARYKAKITAGDTDLGLYWLMHATVILATAPKGRIVDEAWGHLVESGKAPRREIPDEALDGKTRRGRRMGRRGTNVELRPFTGDLDVLAQQYRRAKRGKQAADFRIGQL